MSGYLTSTSLPRVDELSTDPRVFGPHNSRARGGGGGGGGGGGSGNPSICTETGLSAHFLCVGRLPFSEVIYKPIFGF